MIYDGMLLPYKCMNSNTIQLLFTRSQ